MPRLCQGIDCLDKWFSNWGLQSLKGSKLNFKETAKRFSDVPYAGPLRKGQESNFWIQKAKLYPAVMKMALILLILYPTTFKCQKELFSLVTFITKS